MAYNLTNEQLMWWSLGIWVLLIGILVWQLIFGKSLTSQLLPSGNTANTGAGSGGA